VIIMDEVAVVALVEATEAEEVGGGIAGGDGAFGCTTDGRGIVVQDGESALTCVEGLSEDVLMCEHAGELKIAHGEVARGVVVGDEMGLKVRRKKGPPQNGRCTGDKPDAAHARLGGVDSSNTGGMIRNQFGKAGGMVIQINGQGFKVVKLSTDMSIDANAVPIRMADAGLQGTEKSTAAQDCQNHTAEFAQDLLPPL
jgi:hypothetical protein